MGRLFEVFYNKVAEGVIGDGVPRWADLCSMRWDGGWMDMAVAVWVEDDWRITRCAVFVLTKILVALAQKPIAAA